MSRVKTSVTTHKRHKAVLSAVKGHRGSRNRRYRLARESQTHALAYATSHRRLKKRQNRSLQITRINAASRICGISYSQLIYGIRSKGIKIDRKSLSDLAVYEPEVFSELVNKIRSKQSVNSNWMLEVFCQENTIISKDEEININAKYNIEYL